MVRMCVLGVRESETKDMSQGFWLNIWEKKGIALTAMGKSVGGTLFFFQGVIFAGR